MRQRANFDYEYKKMGEAYFFCFKGLLILALFATLIFAFSKLSPRAEITELELTPRGWAPKKGVGHETIKDPN